MNTLTVDLTVEIRCADGTCTQFYEANEQNVHRTLAILANPRVLNQAQLVLASEHGVSVVACRKIDLLIARTSTQPPQVFPLIFPAGLLDLIEQPPDDHSNAAEVFSAADSEPLGPITSYLELQTMGGWAVSLKALAMAQDTIHDNGQSFGHLFELPIIPFRLRDGGLGILNPDNITRVVVRPRPTHSRKPRCHAHAHLRWSPRVPRTVGNLRLTPG